MDRSDHVTQLVLEEIARNTSREEARQTYFDRMIAALEGASEFYWHISVKQAEFKVIANDGTTVVLRAGWRADRDTWALEELEHLVDGERFKREAAVRKQELRASGLAKLTPEERAALDL